MIWSKNGNTNTNPAPNPQSNGGELEPGAVFEKYTVTKLLGKGGMGAVYLVHHNVLDSDFALKILFPEVEKRNKQFVDRFIREAKLCSKIKHPNVISVFDAGKCNDLNYIIMEYAPGGSVRERLKKEFRLSIYDAVMIVRQIADALTAAEKLHMVHRDIKPDNIMFGPDGSAKLADLGIAKQTEENEVVLTQAAGVFGTPAYMSPEQAIDARDVDARADIYSLGIVLYEMLAGQRPYTGKSAIQVLSQVISEVPVPDIRQKRLLVPDEVASLLAAMTAKKKEERIQSAADIVERIDRIPKEELLRETLGTNPGGADFDEEQTIQLNPADLTPLSGNTSGSGPSTTVPGGTAATTATSILNTDYKLGKLLGNGSSGDVYLAQHVRLNVARAIKMYKPSDSDPFFLDRIMHEAQLAVSIRHPNLVEIFDVFIDSANGNGCIVMEYVEGPTLADVLQKQKTLPPAQVLDYLEQAASGLQALAKHGIVHRDIKPGNLMLANGKTLKIGDLGLARTGDDKMPDGPDSQKRYIVGTPVYSAPEQCKDSAQADSRSDLYSLGVCGYECLAGRLPFADGEPREVIARVLNEEPESLQAINPQLPGPLCDLIMKLLDKDPAKRPQSAAELLDEIAGLRKETQRKTAMKSLPKLRLPSQKKAQEQTPDAVKTVNPAAGTPGFISAQTISLQTGTQAESLPKSIPIAVPYARPPELNQKDTVAAGSPVPPSLPPSPPEIQESAGEKIPQLKKIANLIPQSRAIGPFLRFLFLHGMDVALLAVALTGLVYFSFHWRTFAPGLGYKNEEKKIVKQNRRTVAKPQQTMSKASGAKVQPPSPGKQTAVSKVVRSPKKRKINEALAKEIAWEQKAAAMSNAESPLAKLQLPPLKQRRRQWRKYRSGWENNARIAILKAKEKKMKLLLVFVKANSDEASMRLQDTTFISSEFRKFSENRFVPVYIDLDPMSELNSEQMKYNEEVAKLFNPQQEIPLAVFTDASGKHLLSSLKGGNPTKVYLENLQKAFQQADAEEKKIQEKAAAEKAAAEKAAAEKAAAEKLQAAEKQTSETQTAATKTPEKDGKTAEEAE